MTIMRKKMGRENSEALKAVGAVALLTLALVLTNAFALSIDKPEQGILNIKQPVNLTFNVTNDANGTFLSDFTINVQNLDLSASSVECLKNGWIGSVMNEERSVRCVLTGAGSGIDYGEHIQVRMIHGTTLETTKDITLIDAAGTGTNSVKVGYLAVEMFLLSVAAVILQNIIFKRLSNQKVLKGLNESLKAAQREMKTAKESKDPTKMNAVLARTNSVSMKKLQLTMMPNLISSFVFVIMLGWMRARYLSMIVALPLRMPVPAWKWPPFLITPTLGWFGWYLVCAFAASFLIRDLLDVEI